MKQLLTPILLQTTNSSNIYIHAELGLKYSKEPFLNGITNTTNQALFIVSDEKIKELDWYITEFPQMLYQYKKTKGLSSSRGKNSKVIATTNPELNLPQIPQNFIQYFVEKQGNVGKVMVEYEEIDINSYSPTWEEDYAKYGIKHKENLIKRPKLTKDNEVIISLEEKSYTRDEMIAFGQKCGTAGTMAERIGEDFNHLFLQLVEQNL